MKRKHEGYYDTEECSSREWRAYKDETDKGYDDIVGELVCLYYRLRLQVKYFSIHHMRPFGHTLE
jgi:hypothetical protein